MRNKAFCITGKLGIVRLVQFCNGPLQNWNLNTHRLMKRLYPYRWDGMSASLALMLGGCVSARPRCGIPGFAGDGAELCLAPSGARREKVQSSRAESISKRSGGCRPSSSIRPEH